MDYSSLTISTFPARNNTDIMCFLPQVHLGSLNAVSDSTWPFRYRCIVDICCSVLRSMIFHMDLGSMVVQWVTMLPQNSKILGLTPSLFIYFNVLQVPRSPPTSQKHAGRWICCSRSSLGLNVCGPL